MSVFGLLLALGATESFASKTLLARMRISPYASKTGRGITVYENGTALFVMSGTRSFTKTLMKDKFADIKALAEELEGVKVKVNQKPKTCRTGRDPSVRIVSILSRNNKEKDILSAKHCALTKYKAPTRESDLVTAQKLADLLAETWESQGKNP